MKRKLPSLDKRYSRQRPLSPEEAALWREAMEGGEAEPEKKLAKREKKPAVKRPSLEHPTGSPKKKGLPEPIDRRTHAKLRQGSIKVEATLDLHGHTRETAHASLIAFVLAMRAQAKRLVLVITGKGKAGDGALKAELPRWLHESPLRDAVIAYDSAAPRHGGEGAFYIRIRKQRHHA